MGITTAVRLYHGHGSASSDYCAGSRHRRRKLVGPRRLGLRRRRGVLDMRHGSAQLCPPKPVRRARACRRALAPTRAGPVEPSSAPRPFRRARASRRGLVPNGAGPRPGGPASHLQPAQLVGPVSHLRPAQLVGPASLALALRCLLRRRPALTRGGDTGRGVRRTWFGRRLGPAGVGYRRHGSAGHLGRRSVPLLGVLGHT